MAALTDVGLFNPDGGAALDPETWYPHGVRGVNKVAARFVYALLTRQGSVPGRPSDGSPFAAAVRGFRSDFDVFAAFAASEPAASATVRAAQKPDEPDSEKLGFAAIAAVSVSDGVLTITLQVRSLDGSRLKSAIDFVADV